MVVREQMRFQTGNQLFDHISNLQEGSTILVLDETGFESLIFLNALFHNFSDKSNVIFVSDTPMETPFTLQHISLDGIPSLTALSIEVDKYRKLLKDGGVIIHNYLPHMLVREEEERILKLVESWRERALNEKTVEVYSLPKGSFPSFEKKLLSLLSGIITIKLVEKEKGKQPVFQMSGISKAAYHLAEFPFLVKENRLLIKWGDEFTDKVFEEEQDQVLTRQKYIEDNMYGLQIADGGRQPSGVDIYEQWLLTQCVGRDVSEIYSLFPDRFKEISRSLALWNLRGIVKLEEKRRASPPPTRKEISARTKLAFKLPTAVAMSSLTKQPNLIPLDVYHALRRSVTTFITYYTPLSEKEFIEKLSILEGHFQEMAARATAMRKLIENRENPSAKLDVRYLPKTVSITLYYGYHLKSRVLKMSPGEYEVHLKDCFLCAGVVSETPVCQLIAGTIVGSCGVLFKQKFSCRETRCKAMGDGSCVFSLKALSE